MANPNFSSITPEDVAQIMDRHAGNHLCVTAYFWPSSEPCLPYRLAAHTATAWQEGYDQGKADQRQATEWDTGNEANRVNPYRGDR